MQKTIKLSGMITAVGVVVTALALVAALSTAHAQDVATDDKDLRAIASRCVGAQSKVRTLQQQTTESGVKRIKLYDQVDARLWVAIGKIKLGGKDTAELQKLHAELNEKTAKYTELNQTYVQTLGELALIGCKDDPATFKATLETARNQNTEIRTLNSEIRTFITQDVKSGISAFTASDDEASSDDSSEVSEE